MIDDTLDATLNIGRFTVNGVIDNRYRVQRRIAAGGMATVFLAEDLRHGRNVAVKVLHESLTHTIGIQRFLREIEVIARLQHPHLLTLIDSGDANGLPYYVMPFVEAQSLREYIEQRGQLGFEDAIRITREVADGLTYAHKNGVIHRDIKPSNILMSDGHAVVADFGIATALQRASVGRITETGISLGSPTYMSPEQASGERDVDARSDVYSLACVLYEMLAGKPPIDSESMQEVVTRKLTSAYTQLRELRPDVPTALESAIHRALSADREQRQQTTATFAHDIASNAPANARISRRLKLTAAVAAGLVLIAGTVGFQHGRRIESATQRIADINRLTRAGEYDSAFNIASEILPVIPNDTALQRLRPLFTDFLTIKSEPAGVRVSLMRLDPPDSVWRSIGVTPIDGFATPKFGSYRARFERDGYKTAEALAGVFVDYSLLGGSAPLAVVRLDTAGAFPGMVRVSGRRVIIRRDTFRLADFRIGQNEVTNAEYARFVAAGGYEKREYWEEPMKRDDRPVAWEDGMRVLRDSSGRLGPSTWKEGRFPDGKENYPVGGVSFYEAAAYARWAGMRLPTSMHWDAAAMRSSRESGWTFVATSNVSGSGVREVGKGAANALGLFDVFGNVREWCANPMTGGHLTRGGGWEDAEWVARNRVPRSDFDRSASNGFRVMTVTDADTTIAKVSRRITRTVRRDLRDFKPVPDAVFAIYRRMYDYDRPPLDAKIEAEGEYGSFHWQRVSFTAGYGKERMDAYLYLPKNATPPFDPILFWPPGNPSILVPTRPSFMFMMETLLAFVPHSGRAILLPVFKGSPARDGDTYKDVRLTIDSTAQYRDLVVQWMKDMRRTIDYAESRKDLASNHLGFYGVSWGGDIGTIALAIEPRFKAAVFNSGGYHVATTPRPEVDAPNYAPHVRTPFLLLSGQHDESIFPYEISQRPLIEQIGTPLADKKRFEYAAASHLIPQDVVVRESLGWFDRYLRR